MAQGQKLTLVSTPEEIKSWTELKTVPNKFSYFPVKFQANGTAQSLLGSLEEKMGHTGTMIIGAAIPREISIGFVKMVRKTGSRMKIFLVSEKHISDDYEVQVAGFTDRIHPNDVRGFISGTIYAEQSQ